METANICELFEKMIAGYAMKGRLCKCVWGDGDVDGDGGGEKR